MNNNARKRTRFAQRLTPMTLMGRADTEGVEKVALKVLAPHFHQEPFKARTVCAKYSTYATRYAPNSSAWLHSLALRPTTLILAM